MGKSHGSPHSTVYVQYIGTFNLHAFSRTRYPICLIRPDDLNRSRGERIKQCFGILETAWCILHLLALPSDCIEMNAKKYFLVTGLHRE